MKLQAYGVMIVVVTLVHAEIVSRDLPPYANTIIEIQELAGATVYTLVLRLEKQHPIVTYAPANFAQSQDDSIHRYILPNTTLSQDLQNDMVHILPSGSGVEILLFGRLIAQTQDDHMIVFMIESSEEPQS